VAAYDRRKAHNPELEDAIAILRAWNGQMEKDQAAPLVVTLAFQHLRRAVAENASPRNGAAYEREIATEVLEGLLRNRPPGWFPDYDLLLLRVLADGVDEGRRIQGRNVKKWRYGGYLQLTLVHPVGHRLPLVAKYFDLGPVAMSGSSSTVKQTTAKLGPSMRMTADLADWDRSLMNLTIGQSGQILSRHYKDEWDRYYAGKGYPMQFGRVDAGSVLEFVPGDAVPAAH
jgi:penicillin amidase